MLCKKCGSNVEGMSFCENCGTKVEQEVIQPVTVNSSPNSLFSINKLNKKNMLIIGGIVFCIILYVIIDLLSNSKPARTEALVTLEKHDYLKFTIADQDYYLGDKVTEFKSNNLTYDDKFSTDNFVYSDSISTRTFFNEDDESQFLGALYCPSNKNCNYSETVVVKANFYKNSDVVVNDYITFGMSYDDIVEKYGKEDGKFYQDSELLIWTFGKEIGDPYYILRFNTGGWFSTGEIIDIRIGVWWYEGEYEHIVVSEDSEGSK